METPSPSLRRLHSHRHSSENSAVRKSTSEKKERKRPGSSGRGRGGVRNSWSWRVHVECVSSFMVRLSACPSGGKQTFSLPPFYFGESAFDLRVASVFLLTGARSMKEQRERA